MQDLVDDHSARCSQSGADFVLPIAYKHKVSKVSDRIVMNEAKKDVKAVTSRPP